jgi:hypothetical protein
MSDWHIGEVDNFVPRTIGKLLPVDKLHGLSVSVHRTKEAHTLEHVNNMITRSLATAEWLQLSSEMNGSDLNTSGFWMIVKGAIEDGRPRAPSSIQYSLGGKKSFYVQPDKDGLTRSPIQCSTFIDPQSHPSDISYAKERIMRTCYLFTMPDVAVHSANSIRSLNACTPRAFADRICSFMNRKNNTKILDDSQLLGVQTNRLWCATFDRTFHAHHDSLSDYYHLDLQEDDPTYKLSTPLYSLIIYPCVLNIAAVAWLTDMVCKFVMHYESNLEQLTAKTDPTLELMQRGLDTLTWTPGHLDPFVDPKLKVRLDELAAIRAETPSAETPRAETRAVTRMAEARAETRAVTRMAEARAETRAVTRMAETRAVTRMAVTPRAETRMAERPVVVTAPRQVPTWWDLLQTIVAGVDDSAKVYTVYQVFGTPYGPAIKAVCCCFGRGALMTRQHSALTKRMLSILGHGQTLALIIVRRGVENIHLARGFSVLNIHGSLIKIDSAVGAVIADLETKLSADLSDWTRVWPERGATMQVINSPVVRPLMEGNNMNAFVYLYSSRTHRVLWNMDTRNVVHYEELRKKNWFTGATHWVAFTNSTGRAFPPVLPGKPFLSFGGGGGGGKGGGARGGGRKGGSARSHQWVTTGRKVAAAGGRQKVVFRNTLSGELRVRRLATRPDGSKHVTYVKFAQSKSS